MTALRLSLLLALVAFPAFAGPVGLSVGEVKRVTVSQRLARVEATDMARVEIAYKGATVTLTGKETGRTTVKMVTVDGAEVSLDVHVVSPGARVFEIEKQGSVAKREKVPPAKEPAEKAEAQAQDVP